jgi:hypothetical protein
VPLHILLSLLFILSFLCFKASQPRYDINLDIIIKDNIRINDRVFPGLLRKLELRVMDIRKEEEEEKEARAAQLRASPEAVRGGKYVTGEEIQKANSYPIASILGNRRLRTCPFHDDQVPSLSVDHNKNLWQCFACSRSGNVIQLIMEMEGINFTTAVRWLCNK